MSEMYHACNSCMHRNVLIHTVHGHAHRGVIVGVDEQNVYLDTAGYYGNERVGISSKKVKKMKTSKVKTSAFGFGGFGPGFGFGFGRQSILTLALFDLLAIALIS